MIYSWNRIVEIALRHKPRLVRANIIAILATVAAVPVPLLLPLLVDEVLLDKPGSVLPFINQFVPDSMQVPALYIFSMVVVAIVLRMIALGLNVWQCKQFSIVAKDTVCSIRLHLIERLNRISMAEYETLGSGAVAAYFITDLDTLDRFLGSTISRFLVATLTIIGTAVILIWMHWQLALLILVFNPVVIYFTTILGKKVKELKRKENAAYQVFQQSLTETLDAIQQIRAANRERHYLSRLADQVQIVRDNSIQFEWKSDAANRMSFMMFLCGVDIFRAAAMLTVVFSDLSVGMMFAFFGYLWFMMGPVQEVLNIQYSYYGARAALERINTLFSLNLEPEYEAKANPFMESDSISVTAEDIHFYYGDGEGDEILKGLSLHIQPGEKVALVGASGGGKSTLVQVILGLYPPQSGSIRFNGVPVSEIGLDVVRENVSTVLQQPALFNDTVRNNLTLGREFPEEKLWNALNIAQMEARVRELPEGLDTIVGRQGIRLSGGQRQRLAIARMVLSNPSVVILDEATSALDAETEFRLHQALSEFLRGRTTIIIAHRLSAVKQADRVYVFEDGKVSEEGSHAQLIAQGGLYAQLYGERQK
ncbi:MAG: ABC transporter ATP-binding protein [Gammaproteobacteria bacterium]|nr:MAG: ABC transporter ATP-binding protein [Pseudomonadota bacterium]PIE38163.1 MAG: ABC transporter ATP-binding protein [Gammaproteobacteria bacterium]